MKNPALQRKNLYNKNEVEHSHEMAIYQGMAMVFVTLEWHYGWKQKRLNRLFERIYSPLLKYRPSLVKHRTHWNKCSISSRIIRLTSQRFG